MSIIIVDDSDVVRSVIKKVLFIYGYHEIIEAEDGVSALEKIKQSFKKIDLYIFDVNMPRMDGITLVGEVRKLDISKPIIMLTTETDKEKMLRAKKLGATGWVVKPFDSHKFMQVVDMFLKKK